MILAGVVAEEKASSGGGVPAFITSGKAVGPSTSSSAFDTIGATLLVAAVVSYASTPTAPTDSQSNSWVQIPATYGSGGPRVTIWYCYNPTTSATHTFTNPSEAYGGGIYLAFSGTLQTSGVIGNYNGLGTATASPFQTGSVTPSLNDVVIALCGEDGNLTSAAIDSGFTTSAGLTQASNVSEVSAAAYLVSPGTSPVNPTFTLTGVSANWVAAIACFHAA